MKKIIPVLLAAAFGLSACSSLDGKQPHEMVNISMNRMLTKDYSYNYAAEGRVFTSSKEQGLAPEAALEAEAKRASGAAAEKVAAETKVQEAEQKLAAAKKIKSKKQRRNAVAEAQSSLDEAKYEAERTGTPSEPLGVLAANGLAGDSKFSGIGRYLSSGRLKINGALDLRRKKLEAIPELSYQARNEGGHIRIPMLIDAEDMSLTVEAPASVAALAGIVLPAEAGKQIADKPVRFELSDIPNAEKYPVKTAVKALFVASVKAYGDLPAEQFKAMPLDGFAREVGAKYRISMKMDAANLKAYDASFQKHFQAEYERLQKASPKTGVPSENYGKTRELISKILESSSKESADMFEKMLGAPMIADFYLDRKGRMKGQRIYAQVNGSKEAFNVDFSVKQFNFGKPKFTFTPDKAQTVTFKQLKASWEKEKTEKAGETETTEAGEENSQE